MKSDDLPPSLTQPCDRPVLLPDALSDRDVEVFWGRDRAALVKCAGQVEVLAGRSGQGQQDLNTTHSTGD